MEKKQSNKWFAIRVPYGREIKLKTCLDSKNIESFIPMRMTEIIRKGKKKKELLPAIRNLIFIYTERSILDVLKAEFETDIPIRYIIDRAKKKPITIPDGQMKHFIVLSSYHNEPSLYLNNVGPTLKNGAHIRVVDGIFKGVEGTVVRIKRDKRVMVNIDGLIAIISAHIHPSLIQQIDTD